MQETLNEETLAKCCVHKSENLIRLLELPRDLEILHLTDICCKANNVHLACKYLK